MTHYTAAVFMQLLEDLDAFGLANGAARRTHSFKQLTVLLVVIMIMILLVFFFV